jgi:hypothetical protein
MMMVSPMTTIIIAMVPGVSVSPSVVSLFPPTICLTLRLPSYQFILFTTYRRLSSLPVILFPRPSIQGLTSLPLHFTFNPIFIPPTFFESISQLQQTNFELALLLVESQ